MMVNQPPTLRNLWETFKEKEKEAKAREAMFAQRQRGKKKERTPKASSIKSSSRNSMEFYS